MEMLQLKYFKAVAEMGKISAAAESLFISPPALSAAISRLEKDLGMPPRRDALPEVIEMPPYTPPVWEE